MLLLFPTPPLTSSCSVDEREFNWTFRFTFSLCFTVLLRTTTTATTSNRAAVFCVSIAYHYYFGASNQQLNTFSRYLRLKFAFIRETIEIIHFNRIHFTFQKGTFWIMDKIESVSKLNHNVWEREREGWDQIKLPQIGARWFLGQNKWKTESCWGYALLVRNSSLCFSLVWLELDWSGLVTTTIQINKQSPLVVVICRENIMSLIISCPFIKSSAEKMSSLQVSLSTNVIRQLNLKSHLISCSLEHAEKNDTRVTLPISLDELKLIGGVTFQMPCHRYRNSRCQCRCLSSQI